MPVTLSPQSVRELGEEGWVPADVTGNTAPNAPGTFLGVANASGGPLRVRLASAVKCRLGRNTHAVERTIPDGVTRYLPLHALDVDPQMRRRFGDGVQITYPDGVVNLDVALARVIGWFGVGIDDESPPAIGANPGVVPVSSKDDVPAFAAAAVDGMRLASNDGKTQLWVDNAGPAPREVYFHASRPCDFGIHDDEKIVIGVGERYITRELPIGRFGRFVNITYDAETGLAFAAIRQEAYKG